MSESITSMQGAFDLTGKNAIITGGNRGLGFGIAKAFAQSGANVAIFCRDAQKAAEAIEELKPCGGNYQSFSCDILSLPNVREAVAAAYAAFGNIDILVNNAGVSGAPQFLDMDEDLSDWYRILNTNLNGLVHMTYEVGKRMRDAGKGGSIVNLTSNAGLMVNRGFNMSAYASSKAAANHFSRVMAVELGPYGITVNALCPGFINDGFGRDMPPEMEKKLADSQVVNRMGTVMEIGAMAVYLVSPAARYTTGSINVVDGGYMLQC